MLFYFCVNQLFALLYEINTDQGGNPSLSARNNMKRLTQKVSFFSFIFLPGR